VLFEHSLLLPGDAEHNKPYLELQQLEAYSSLHIGGLPLVDLEVGASVMYKDIGYVTIYEVNRNEKGQATSAVVHQLRRFRNVKKEEPKTTDWSEFYAKHPDLEHDEFPSDFQPEK
jgi:hypothetical protein